jgi:hypothetical protein
MGPAKQHRLLGANPMTNINAKDQVAEALATPDNPSWFDRIEEWKAAAGKMLTELRYIAVERSRSQAAPAPVLWRQNMTPIEQVVENSFKDFHAKGLDYICLERSPEFTRKLYLLDGPVSGSPEVVNPHDHRYRFRTTVRGGVLINHTFTPSPDGELYDAFDYRTPLNGGNGFTWRGVERLARDKPHALRRGERLTSVAGSIHTISTRYGAILELEQWADEIPIGVPTSCWTRDTQPNLDTAGLYSKFTADEIIHRLTLVDSALGTSYLERIIK